MFKVLMGRGHPEFSSTRQQDALEFFQHIVKMVQRFEHPHGPLTDPTRVFAFELEQRVQCHTCKGTCCRGRRARGVGV
jgi:ubiquitin carboxyl-terminal hydrolase 5/13